MSNLGAASIGFVSAALIAIANLGLGVDSGDSFNIILGTIWLLFFCLTLWKYRRAQRRPGTAPAP